MGFWRPMTFPAFLCNVTLCTTYTIQQKQKLFHEFCTLWFSSVPAYPFFGCCCFFFYFAFQPNSILMEFYLLQRRLQAHILWKNESSECGIFRRWSSNSDDFKCRPHKSNDPRGGEHEYWQCNVLCRAEVFLYFCQILTPLDTVPRFNLTQDCFLLPEGNSNNTKWWGPL